MNKAIQTILYVALAVILVVCGVFVYNFFNNGQKIFAIQYGETRINSDTTLELQKDTYSLFSAINVLGVSADDKYVEDFTVSVKPKTEYFTDVSITVDGEEHAITWNQLNFSKSFSVKKDGSMVSVYVPYGLTFLKAVTLALPEHPLGESYEVSISCEDFAIDKDYFILSFNYPLEKTTINVGIY